MRIKRWRLQDPVSLGFRLMLRAERRMARKRIFWARAKYLGALAMVTAGTVGSLVGTAALFAWVQGVA